MTTQKVFISYKSEEESWAARIAETLKEFGVPVWRDHDKKAGLALAEQWLPEIETAIAESTDMIVLWSRLLDTDAKSIAHHEIQKIRQKIQDRGGRFIPVMLDGTSFEGHLPFQGLQGDVSFKDAYGEHSARGADQVNDLEWYSLMLPLLKFFRVEGIVEVPFVVGAMNRKQAEDLFSDPANWAQDKDLYDAISALRQRTLPFDAKHYGVEPDDWRPFPHIPDWASRTVRDFIYAYDQQKRDYLSGCGKSAKWVPISYSSQILSDKADIRAEAGKATHNKCLVVLDPMSLLHKHVHSRLMNSWGLQARQNAFLIGLAPCAYQMHADFLKALPDVAKSMMEMLDSTYARFAASFEAIQSCVLEVGHQHQFARWLQVGADSIIEAGQSPLRSGSMHPKRRAQVSPQSKGAPGASVVVLGANPESGL